MSNNNKIPTVVYYDTESKIVSADYRSKDNLHICLDEDGNFIIRNIKGEKDHKKIKMPNVNFKYVKFNPINDYQFFVCSENFFKIYDIRNNLEMDSISIFANSVEVLNDSKNFLLASQEGLELYYSNITKMDKIKEWKTFGQLCHANMNSQNYNDPDIIVLRERKWRLILF